MFDANTVLNHLVNVEANGAGRLVSALGAKHIAYSEADTYVTFSFMRGAKNKANRIKITLNHNDLYDVEFFTIRKFEKSIKGEFNNIFCGDLKELFEKETALYLSL